MVGVIPCLSMSLAMGEEIYNLSFPSTILNQIFLGGSFSRVGKDIRT
jgi:hypothetical protein